MFEHGLANIILGPEESSGRTLRDLPELQARYDVISVRSSEIVKRFRALLEAAELPCPPEDKMRPSLFLDFNLDDLNTEYQSETNNHPPQARIMAFPVGADDKIAPQEATSFRLRLVLGQGDETTDVGETYNLILPYGSEQKIQFYDVRDDGVRVLVELGNLTDAAVTQLETAYSKVEHTLVMLVRDLCNAELNPDFAIQAKNYYERHPELLMPIITPFEPKPEDGARRQDVDSMFIRKIRACGRALHLLN